MAIDLNEAHLPQPACLLRKVSKPVTGVVLNSTDFPPEELVQARRCRADEIEIREHTARCQQRVDFSEKLTLPLVLEVVDRQSGHHGINRPRVPERNVQVMLAELD